MAQIVNGVWSLQIGSGKSWQQDGWRTDFPESLMSGHPDLWFARYYTSDGQQVVIPIAELRTALADAPRRTKPARRGNFNIHPFERALVFLGKRKQLPGLRYFGIHQEPQEFGKPHHALFRGPETEWHARTVEYIARNPEVILQRLDRNPVVRTWCDSVRARDTEGTRLWLCLFTGKHPDVVFEQRDRLMTIIEVEPDDYAQEGFVQLWGDYLVAMRIERQLRHITASLKGVLVTQNAASILASNIGNALMNESGITILNMP